MSQDGYSSAGALAAVILLSLGIMGIAFFTGSLLKFTDTYRRHYKRQDAALEVLERLTEAMQELAGDECDNEQSRNRNDVLDAYSGYGLVLEDVSSGINGLFLAESVVSDPGVAGLIELKGDEVMSSYGWIPMNFRSLKISDAVQSSFGTSDAAALFPLVNRFPVLNLFYADADLIPALLNAVGVKDYERKAGVLDMRIHAGNLSDSEIASILGIEASDRILDLFGLKTSFWKASFSAGGCSVRAIYAAVPEDEASRTAVRYVLIEKELEF